MLSTKQIKAIWNEVWDIHEENRGGLSSETQTALADLKERLEFESDKTPGEEEVSQERYEAPKILHQWDIDSDGFTECDIGITICLARSAYRMLPPDGVLVIGQAPRAKDGWDEGRHIILAQCDIRNLINPLGMDVISIFRRPHEMSYKWLVNFSVDDAIQKKVSADIEWFETWAVEKAGQKGAAE